MKTHRFFLAAALLISGTALHAGVAAPITPRPVPPPRVQVPVPMKIVHPSNLPEEYRNMTLDFAFVVDAAGVPHDIKPVGYLPVHMSERLIPVLAQWRFSPALRDGQPVPMRVVLPVKLIEEERVSSAN